jgi:hypothetical protein
MFGMFEARGKRDEGRNANAETGWQDEQDGSKETTRKPKI